jgi:hypothetical protein
MMDNQTPSENPAQSRFRPVVYAYSGSNSGPVTTQSRNFLIEPHLISLLDELGRLSWPN